MTATTVTFHGGVNEVGGNKIILEDGHTKVLLDFGMSFSLRSQYYSVPFLSPRDESGLLEFGIIPDLKGVYRFDPTAPQIDAVFLSHSHMDHAAYISFLKRDIPVYSGETTATILDALSEIRLPSLEFNLGGVSLSKFRTGDKIVLGSLEVEPIHVDHSVPGSYGFIIRTSSGTVVYTGDFRLHGSKPSLTQDFFDIINKEEINAVITENTNMTGVEVSSENEVMEKLNTIMAQTHSLVLVDFACSDIDRLRSFYEATINNDRCLVVTLKQAYLLDRLSSDPHLNIPKMNDERLLIFQRRKKKYATWEQKAMRLGRIIDSMEISKKQTELVLALSFCDLGELTEIKPSSGSCYILSASEPFNEEMEIDFSRLINWLEHYGLPQYHIHVSGHVMPHHLRESLRMLKPKQVFPVHGTHPELFSKYMRDTSGKIIVPEKGRTYGIL